MDRSLVRGYANQCLRRIPTHGSVMAWHDSPRCARALERFTESSLSKKPGRVLERLAPLVAPAYGGLRVREWNRKGQTVVSASSVSSALQSTILHPEDQGRSLFDERAAFLNHLVFASRGEHAVIYGATTTGVGGHAIGRLLERKLATPETLMRSVLQLLARANALQLGLGQAGLDARKPWSLLFPVPGGAAGAVTHRVLPSPGQPPEHCDLVASVRTVLREDMLSPEQKDRMVGFESLFTALDADPMALDAWILRNARPWVQPQAEHVGSDPGLALEDPPPGC